MSGDGASANRLGCAFPRDAGSRSVAAGEVHAK